MIGVVIVGGVLFYVFMTRGDRAVRVEERGNERKHELYKDGEANIPDSIKDRNGQVALGLCKNCKKGEADLSQPCYKKQRGQSTIDYRVAELEAKLKEYEADARRLELLMTMSGEMYQESTKHQFVGRLKEFVDNNAWRIDQAMKGGE